MQHEPLIQPQGRVLPTLEADGRRRWITPRLACGRYHSGRRWVAYVLIAIFTLIPFITINGKPAVLLNVAQRKFTLFGYTFLPTDTMLLALLMVALILSIFFITALLGRAWCGWACPQTVYMEFLFRPIERLCMGRAGVGGKPTKEVAGWRIGAMYLLYLLAAFYLAHTFLSYFVGVEQLRHWITQSPANHPASFLIVVFVTAAMMFDFTYFREQTCLIACPYGRFQSVLLDRDSLVVSYDKARGEPRGKRKAESRERKAETQPVAIRIAGRTIDSGSAPISSANSSLSAIRSPLSARNGDCVDCNMCVQVCPTGIDIRDGLQFECITCTQCIDACDAVMDKIKRPRGLIRYTSQAALEGRARHIIRPRVLIYAGVITALLSLLTYFIITKSPFDVHLVRQGGLPFIIAPDGRAENVMRLNLTNRSEVTQKLTVEVVDAADVELSGIDQVAVIDPGKMIQKPIHIFAPTNSFHGGRRTISVRVSDSLGKSIEKQCLIFGPGTAASTGAKP